MSIIYTPIIALTVHMTQHHRDKGGEQPTGDSIEVDPNRDIQLKIEDSERQVVNQSIGEDIEGEGESLAHLFTQSMEEGPQTSSPSTSSRLPTTFVRQTDGKIVAKQGVLKKCKYCNFQTDTFAKLQKHEAAYHPEKKFKCPLCEIKFENLVWLQRHLTHMHQEDTEANNIVTILEQLNPKRKRNKPIPSTSTPSTSTPLSQSIPEVLAEGLPKQPNVQMKRKHAPQDKNPTQCQVCGYVLSMTI
jgi:hypothetical protein